jgi:ParB family chromosome partitioning protein
MHVLTADRVEHPASGLTDAATSYKVDNDAIAAKIRQEFAAREKAKKTPQSAVKTAKKTA